MRLRGHHPRRRDRPARLVLLFVLTLLAGGIAASRVLDDGFPHPKHEKLFPICEGCHEGIASGVAETSFPPATTCAQCHDGVRKTAGGTVLKPVRWTARRSPVSNLRFRHREHFAHTDSVVATDSTRAITCRSCHALERPAGRMSVGEARQPLCASCHVAAREHQSADSPCGTCHVPVAQAGLPAARIAAIRRPVWHDTPSFATDHAKSSVRSTGSCEFCHARESCEGCHSSLARAGASTPQRVAKVRRVHPVDVATRHGSLAASGKLSCTTCHSQQTCASCHAGQDSRAFHATNFVERHAVDAFAASANCQSCHSVSRFCRDCHTKTGAAADSRMNAAFHNADASWVLSHGQAARRGMEGCASCHRQSDCVRCHSASGGWGVKPHGPGFPATRLSARKAGSCRWCHTGPAGGGL